MVAGADAQDAGVGALGCGVLGVFCGFAAPLRLEPAPTRALGVQYAVDGTGR